MMVTDQSLPHPLHLPLFSTQQIPLKSLDDIRARILSPTDEHPDDVTNNNDDVIMSGGAQMPVVRDCADLDIDEIEDDSS